MADSTTANTLEILKLQQRPFATWTVAETASWVSYIGFPQWCTTFIENSVAGDVLAECTQQDLIDMGIDRLGDRKKLLRHIASLADGSGTQGPPSSVGGASSHAPSTNTTLSSGKWSDASSTNSSNDGDSATVAIKCAYRDDVRLLRLKDDDERTLKGLKAKLKREWGRRFDLYYRDADGDRLSIKSDGDFDAFMEQPKRRLELRSSSSSSSSSSSKSSKRESKVGDTVLTREETELLQNLVDGMVVIDKKGYILFLNASAERIFGWRFKELEGKNVKKLMPDDIAAEHDGYLKNYLRTKVAKVIGTGRTVTGKRKDGTTVRVSLTLSEMKTKSRHTFTGRLQEVLDADTGGAPSGTTKSDGAVSASAQYTILDNILDAAVVCDERGIMQFFNKRASAMFGYAPMEIIGRNVKLLMPSPFADEHDDYLRRYADGAPPKIIGTGRNVVALTKDGSIKQVHLSLSEQKLGGQRRIFTGILREHAPDERANVEQKSLLAQERDVLSTLIVPAIILSADGVINGWNKKAEELFGYGPMEALGKNIKMVMQGDDAAKHDEYLRAFCAEPKKQSKVVGVGRPVTGVHKDGSIMPLFLSVTTKTENADGSGKRIFTGIMQPQS